MLRGSLLAGSRSDKRTPAACTDAGSRISCRNPRHSLNVDNCRLSHLIQVLHRRQAFVQHLLVQKARAFDHLSFQVLQVLEIDGVHGGGSTDENGATTAERLSG